MSQPNNGDAPKTFRDDLDAWLRGFMRVVGRIAGGLNGNPSPEIDGARPFFSNKGAQATATGGAAPRGRGESESEIPGGRFTLVLLAIGFVLLFAKNLTENDQPDSMDLYVTRLSESYVGPDASSQRLEDIPRGRHVPPGEKRVEGWRRLNRERVYIRAANLSPIPRLPVKVFRRRTYLRVGQDCQVSQEADGSVPAVLVPGRYRIHGTVTDPASGTVKYEVLLPREGVVYAAKGACIAPPERRPEPPRNDTPPPAEAPETNHPPPAQTPHVDTRPPGPGAADDTSPADRPAYVAELEESGLKTIQPRHVLRGLSPEDLTLSDPDAGPTALVVARCRIEFSVLRGWTVRQCNILGSEEHREKYKARVRQLSIKFALNGRELERSGIEDLDNVLVPFPFRNPAHRRPPAADVTTREERPDADRDAGVDQGHQ